MILNASAENGSASSARRCVGSPRRVLAGHRRHVGRRRQEVDHRVQQRLHALVLERRAHQHRHRAARDGRPPQRRPQELASSSCVALPGTRASPRRPPRRSPRSSSARAIAAASASSAGMSATSGVAPSVSSSQTMHLHLDQVDDAGELVLEPVRDLDDDRRAAQPLADLLHAAIGIGADAVALVDEGDARHAVAVGLAPDRLRLRLDAAHRAEHAPRRRRAPAGCARPRW